MGIQYVAIVSPMAKGGQMAMGYSHLSESAIALPDRQPCWHTHAASQCLLRDDQFGGEARHLPENVRKSETFSVVA